MEEKRSDGGHARELRPSFSEFARQTRRNDEAVLGKVDCGFEQARPGQFAVLRMRHRQHPQGARHANGKAARDGFVVRARIAARIQEHVWACRCRRGFAAVISGERAII